jgi:hypothetical protein
MKSRVENKEPECSEVNPKKRRKAESSRNRKSYAPSVRGNKLSVDDAKGMYLPLIQEISTAKVPTSPDCGMYVFRLLLAA